jgi:hypothetical protein
MLRRLGMLGIMLGVLAGLMFSSLAGCEERTTEPPPPVDTAPPPPPPDDIESP